MKKKEIGWKTHFLLFSIYLCLFIFFKGCGTSEKGIPDPPESLSNLPPVSDRLVARIYFDATLSMQGFVAPGSTHYTRIYPYLESVIVSGWRDETVNFFQFGERVEPIDRDTYLQVGDESFYQTDIGIKTYIEKVIENEAPLINPQKEASRTPEIGTETTVNDAPEETEANSTEDRLVVIVTDLFQDDGDINRLLPELKEKYIKKGVDVGLFGLQSQFDGMVYDIGIGPESSMRYRGIRPFYLLVLGKHADIAHYFNKLTSEFSEAKTVIFSRYLVDPLLSFDGATINEVVNLNSTSYVSPDPRLKQYEIREDSDPAKISAISEYKLLPHVMLFDSDTFEISAIAKHAPGGETERCPEAEECLEVIPSSTLSNNEDVYQLSINFNLAAQDLESGVYLYEVTLLPGIDSYRTPDWCSDWDMGRARDGAKTLNLANFVRHLSQVTVQIHKPKIAQFYCYIGQR